MTTVLSERSAAPAPPPMDDTPRVADLRERVRRAMERPPAGWACPERIAPEHMTEPIPIRKARAIALKLAHMPTDLWAGQFIAGSMTLEDPRVHCEWGFPDYLTPQERTEGAARGLNTSCFGHIVPDYPRLLTLGLGGIQELARGQFAGCRSAAETAFLESVLVATDGVLAFASRLADRCEAEALAAAEGRPGGTANSQSPAAADPAATAVTGPARAAELRQMAENLRQSPSGPARTFWQALQSVWLLHMVFHSTLNGNAAGRVDQYTWPLLQADLAAGRIDMERAGELVDCFCLKFNERAKATEDQAPDARPEEHLDPSKRTRHSTSSQIGTERDGIDATNHWLQNIVVGGLRPDGQDGTNPVTFLLLESYRRNRMTNPLLTVRLHAGSPAELVRRACETLKEGGGMPAIFSDEAIIPALERLGIPTSDARDYTNDGCWEVILPGRTDFRFQRLSVMLCLEWALNRGRSRLDGARLGIDTGDARGFQSFEDVWRAFEAQLGAMVAATLERVTATFDDRSILAPVPLLSALIDGAVESRRDMTAGGAKFRTFALLAEGAAHAIDSLSAIRHVVFERRQATLAELCDAMDVDFRGHEALRRRLQEAPKYGNDDERADSVGRDLVRAFTETVARHAAEHAKRSATEPESRGAGTTGVPPVGLQHGPGLEMDRRDACPTKQPVPPPGAAAPRAKFPCGVGTFSWYIGIGEGLGASPDGRRKGEPVSSNFSPALGMDLEGIPGAILSYAKMHHANLPAGAPLDLRLARRLVRGQEGTERMAGLLRAFVQTGGSIMTLTVADAEELRAAQREPQKHRSLRVRMGGWCAYFTMLSRQQQEHHIRRQEGRP